MAWIICGLLFAVAVYLAVKNFRMRQSLNAITEMLSSEIADESDITLAIKANDKYIKKLAKKLNTQLAELRRIKESFQEGDRELKDAVINITHDLKTPLTAIYGYLDLLDKEEKSETLERYISQISNRINAINLLTEELFRYTVISSVEDVLPEPINLCRVLEETLVSFYGMFEQNGITPIVSIPEAPITRVLDGNALSRIFGNIISNAIKYSDGDFSVTMKENGEIIFSNKAKALYGIDPLRLFERFFTVDPSKRSTGLGLSIAKSLIEKMHGGITAEYSEERLYITVWFDKNI